MANEYDHISNQKSQMAERLVARLTTELWEFFPNMSDSKLEKIEKKFKAVIRHHL